MIFARQILRYNHVVVVALASCLGITVVQCRPCHAFPAGRFSGVWPVVETQKSKKSWTVARVRSTLVVGDRIRTGPRGKAVVVFNNGTRLTMGPRTFIQIEELDTPQQPLVVRLLGTLGEVIVKAKGSTEVRTAAGIAAVQGTTYSVRLNGADQTVLTVSEGRVAFFNPQGRVEVGADEQSTARVGSAPTPPVRVDASGLLSWAGDVAGLPLPFELPPQADDIPELNAAKAQLLAGNAQGAQTAFRALLDSPSADEARAGLALSLLSNGQRDEARQTVGDATTPLASGVRALLLIEAGNAREAQGLLQPLAAAPGATFQTVSLLSLAQIQNGDIVAATQSARRAVELNPQSAGARATLALAQFFARGNDGEARRNAQRALELDPFSPLALLALGRIEAARGNLDEARQALAQAVALSPELPDAQRDLGALEAALDRLPRAERAYRASLERKPDDARSLAGLGSVLLRRGAREEAKTTLDRAVQLAPEDPFVRAQRAAFLVENGELDAAAREGDLLLARRNAPVPVAVVGTPSPETDNDPTLGALFIRLSEAALFQQKLNPALRYAREAVRLLPDSSPAQYQLGRVFLEQGRITQAQSRFQLATILNPDAPRPRYALGFTQELVAQGNDVSRPLGQIAAAREGAPNAALSLQNQESPGASERLQAAIQDPTSVRAASRSFGDWQLDGRLGTNSSATGEVSFARESSDRRGLTAFGLRRDTTQGARVEGDYDYDESRAAITLGRKAKNSPSALFAFASYERIHPSRNMDFDMTGSFSFQQRQRPLLVLGANIAKGETNRTRLLLQVDRSSLDSMFQTSMLRGDFESIHFEARHDRRIDEQWRISAGTSYGQRRYDVGVVSDFSTPTTPLVFFNNANSVIHNAVAYARVAFEPSPKLKLEGELKVRSFVNHYVGSFGRQPADPQFPPFADESQQQGGELLPSVIATWRPKSATLIRYRARRLLGAIEDFELLSPNDLFGFDSRSDVPLLDPGARGHSYELEASHTFKNSSFLRLGLFRVEQGTSGRSDVSEGYEFSRVHGLRIGFEGLLNRQTAFFTSVAWNGSRGSANNPLTGGTFAPSTISGLPDYSGEVGIQYLSDKGFFVQPSVAYLGPRFRGRFDDRDARQRFSGIPFFNVRVGHRSGLRRSFYIEASNLFNSSYSLANNGFQRLQPGRQVRVGATIRF